MEPDASRNLYAASSLYGVSDTCCLLHFTAEALALFGASHDCIMQATPTQG